MLRALRNDEQPERICEAHQPESDLDATRPLHTSSLEEPSAEHVLTGAASTEKAGWAKTIFVSPKGSAHAAVQLKTADGTLVWAYSVDKTNAYKGEQSTAEAIAKHMNGEAVASGK